MVSVKNLGRDSSVRSDLLYLIMTYCWSPWVQQVESNDTPVIDESEATLENTPLSKSRGQFYAKIPGIRWVVFLFQGIYYDFVWFLWFMGVSNCVWMCPTYIASKGPFQCQVYCHNGDLQKGLKVLLGAVGSHRWVTANYQKTERSARSGCSCLWGYIGLTWFYYTTISKKWTYFRQYFVSCLEWWTSSGELYPSGYPPGCDVTAWHCAAIFGRYSYISYMSYRCWVKTYTKKIQNKTE
jgi:hypothetical protein